MISASEKPHGGCEKRNADFSRQGYISGAFCRLKSAFQGDASGVLAGLAWLCVTACVGLLLWGLHRGFDLTDEGFYLLTCTQPERYPRIFTGFNHLVWRVGNLTGLSVPSLRALRLVWLIAANLFFAWGFRHWLLRAWPKVSARVDVLVLPILLLGVPASYLWPPQSPGYNDIAGGAVLCGAGAILLALGWSLERASLPARAFLALGVAGAWLAPVTLAKPTAGLTAALLFGILILGGLRKLRWPYCLAGLLALMAGSICGLVLIHVFFVDVKQFFSTFFDVAGTLSQGSHRPGRLLSLYWRQFIDPLLGMLRYLSWAPLLFFLLPELLCRRSRAPWRADYWLVPGAILVGVLTLGARLDWFRGTNHTDRAVQSWWLLIALAAALAAGAWWRRRAFGVHTLAALGASDTLKRGHQTLGSVQNENGRISAGGWVNRSGLPFVLTVLFLLPFAAAAGTGTPLFSPTIYLAAAWYAVLLVAVGVAMQQRVARPAAALLLVLLLILVVGQFHYGFVHRPYRLVASLTRQTQRVDGLAGNASTLRFDPASADFLGKLAAAYHQVRPAPEQPILALYDLPGLVFLLGGTCPTPSPWLTAAAVSRPLMLQHLATCGTALQHGTPLPFLLLNEELEPDMRQFLQTNGVPFPDGYRLITALTCPWDEKKTELWIPRNHLPLPSENLRQ